MIFVCLVFHNFVRCFSNKALFIFPLLLSFFHICITFFHILFFSFVFKLYLYSKSPISGIFLFYFLHFDIFNVKIRYRAILHHLIFLTKGYDFMNFMNQDNIVVIALNRIGDVIIANLLFLLCSIPLVTIGPSLTALYHCMLRIVKGNEDKVTKTFFRALRQNFVQSLIAWLALVIVGVILFLNTHFLLQNTSEAGKIFYYLSGLVLALLVIIALYIFPVIAAFSNTLKNLVKNSVIFAFMHIPSTLLIAVISILPMYMTYQDLTLLPLYSCCWFFFGFALTCYINSFLFYRIFKPYLETSEETEEIKEISK